MRARILVTTALVALGIGAPSSALALPDGGYIAIGFGAGIASGDQGVPLKATPGISVSASSSQYKELVRTDFGTGLATELRFGYLIQKLVAAELGVSGHGATSFGDGAGFVSFALRYHFLQHAIDLTDRAFDMDVYFGAGYAIGGYEPDLTGADSKGWEGWQWNVGIDFEYQVGENVGIAIDLKFVLPQYGEFIIDYDDDVRVDPSETPDTLVILPTVQLVFHL